MKGQLFREFTRAKEARLKDRPNPGLQGREPKLLRKAHSSKRAASLLAHSGVLAKPAHCLVPAHSESVLRAPRAAVKLKSAGLHSLSLSFQRLSPNRSRNAVLYSSRNSFPLSFLAPKKHQKYFVFLPKAERSEPCVATVNLSCSLPKLQLSTDPLPVPPKPRPKLKSRPFKMPQEPSKEVAEDTFSLSSWKADFSDS